MQFYSASKLRLFTTEVMKDTELEETHISRIR